MTLLHNLREWRAARAEFVSEIEGKRWSQQNTIGILNLLYYTIFFLCNGCSAEDEAIASPLSLPFFFFFIFSFIFVFFLCSFPPMCQKCRRQLHHIWFYVGKKFGSFSSYATLISGKSASMYRLWHHFLCKFRTTRQWNGNRIAGNEWLLVRERRGKLCYFFSSGLNEEVDNDSFVPLFPYS